MNIEHETQGNRFVARLNGQAAKLNYQMIGDVMNIIHTEVPEEHEGQGVASALVRAALDWARENGKKAESTCQFASGWLERHHEYDDILNRD